MQDGSRGDATGIPPLRYTVDGTAVIAGFRIPFSRSGELAGAPARAR